MPTKNFLDAHLNIGWLRPESALWDAIASAVISELPILPPALDLGSGNGLFSFITAGGSFSPEYDWYRNVNPAGFWEDRDIYDTFQESPKPEWIIEWPKYRIDYALDAKANLLQQAQGLGFYRHTVAADANMPLPFADASFQTVFSNILYWLHSVELALRDIRRVLRDGGRALLCLQDHKFKEYCSSYRWKEQNSQLLKLLNRKSESNHWTISYDEVVSLAHRCGLDVVSHTYYLSPLTLKVWDIGLRPLSAVLVKMIYKLSVSDRIAIKSEWIETIRPFLQELYELDRKSTDQGGYHFLCLEKR